jgi:hypothetical protein
MEIVRRQPYNNIKVLFCSTAFQVNYCCTVKENKNIWEGLFILQWLTKSMQVVIKKNVDS